MITTSITTAKSIKKGGDTIIAYKFVKTATPDKPDNDYTRLLEKANAGEKLDREKFEKALDYYYEMMGWDVATGVPREAKLYHLNIADLSGF